MRSYSGKKIAVDARAWLYRGAFGCAFDLCMNLDTNRYRFTFFDLSFLLRSHLTYFPFIRYVTYFIQMVQTLLLYKVIPIIVFEGQMLPLKSENKIQQSL